VNVFLRPMLSDHSPVRAILSAWEAGEFDMLVSTPLLAEIDDVARRLALRGKIRTHDEPDAILDRLWRRAVPVELRQPYPVLDRDPGDSYLLAMLRDGQADYLVTEDQDLLAIHEYAGARIIRIDAFLRLLRGVWEAEGKSFDGGQGGE
jgi:uncharacterized protein